MQEEIGRQVVTTDGFESIKLIGGADCTYFKNLVICCIVVLKYPTMEFVERTVHVGKISFPYISGFFSFREGEGTIKAYQKLSHKPDLLMVNACGTPTLTVKSNNSVLSFAVLDQNATKTKNI